MIIRLFTRTHEREFQLEQALTALRCCSAIKHCRLALQRESRGGVGRGLREAREAASQQGPGWAALLLAVQRSPLTAAFRLRAPVWHGSAYGQGAWRTCTVFCAASASPSSVGQASIWLVLLLHALRT